MKKIVKLTEADLTRIVRKTLLEFKDRDQEFDMDVDMEDSFEDEDTQEPVSQEETQDFINYVCRMNRSWCNKTKEFFSQMN